MARQTEQTIEGYKNKWDLVVAIDIETRYSGYAYCDKKEIEKPNLHFNKWISHTTGDPRAKAPTVVLLDKNKEFKSFGYQAEEQYAKHVENKTHVDYYRFRNFKMKLYEEKVLMKKK